MGNDRDRFIVSSYHHHIIAVSHYHVIAPSPSRHYHGTIASSLSHHRQSIMSSLHPELEGVIVYWVGPIRIPYEHASFSKFKLVFFLYFQQNTQFFKETFPEFYTKRLLNISSALVSIHNLLMFQFMTLLEKLGCLKI